MKNILLSSCLVAAATVVAAPANATITLVAASSIQGDNVLFNDGPQSGDTVFGRTQSGTTVAFTGTNIGGSTTIRANGGQARIEGALDEATNNPNDALLLSSLSFGLVGGNTFNNLEFNILGGNATSVAFALLDDMGTIFNFNRDLGTGSNMFGFVGIDGQSIQNISITLNGGGAGDVRQIRLDEEATAAVPEPATWAMMLVGFGMMGAAMRYRRRSVSTRYA
jgi:hypothetical protein